MSKPHRRGLYFRFLSPEQLELRDMLSGHGFLAGFVHQPGAASQSANFASAASALFAQASARSHVFAALGTFDESSDRTELTAKLADPNGTATGTATFKTYTEDGVTETTLKVSVTGATASSTLSILVGGTTVGTLTTDSTGAGSVVLSTNPKGTEQAFTTAPTGVTAGTSVDVDTLTGNLAVATHTGGGCQSGERSTFTAALTDPNSTATGTATFTSTTKHGVTSTTLNISVTGAAASTALDVLIGTTSVGTLTTDDTGAGTLKVTSGLPTVDGTTTIKVGSLSGTFAASSNSGTGGSYTPNAFRHFRHR